MTSENKTTRRRYGAEFKAQVIAECNVAGASVARVAMAHGINANVVHGWRKVARNASHSAIAQQQAFVPLRLPHASELPTPERGIEVELRRGTVTMKITWPSSAAADFAAWTRELLR